MNDDQLRALVRDAVARHLGRAAGPVLPGADAPGLHLPDAPGLRLPEAPGLPSQRWSPGPSGPGGTHPWQRHASHHLYVSLVNVDGSCVIEPAVACDHCGYCKSHGH